MPKHFLKILLGLFFLASGAQAQTLVLIHGYQGSALSWEKSGVLAVLQQHNWQVQHILHLTQQGIVPQSANSPDSGQRIVLLNLNSETPMPLQADQIGAALHRVRDLYPNDSLIVAGHSLGGVTARLALLRHGHKNIEALVSIASPHLGTELAYQGLDAVDDSFPFSILKSFFAGEAYDTLDRSRQLLVELLPSRPGSLLYWLNRQPHPDLDYYAIVRSTPAGVLGDPVVPGYSQDMSNVPALSQKSQRIIQGFVHELSFMDGYSLLNIVEAQQN